MAAPWADISRPVGAEATLQWEFEPYTFSSVSPFDKIPAVVCVVDEEIAQRVDGVIVLAVF